MILANFLSNRNGLNTISTLMVIALAIVSHDQETITQIKARVLAAGKFLGTIAGDWVRAQARYDKRYQLLILMAGGAAPANLAVAMAAKFQEVYPDR